MIDAWAVANARRALVTALSVPSDGSRSLPKIDVEAFFKQMEKTIDTCSASDIKVCSG